MQEMLLFMKNAEKHSLNLNGFLVYLITSMKQKNGLIEKIFAINGLNLMEAIAVLCLRKLVKIL